MLLLLSKNLCIKPINTPLRLIIPVFLLIMMPFISSAQEKRKFSLDINYGLNGNFFVTSYDESAGPVNGIYLYNKQFLGTITGTQLSYGLNDHSSVFFAYSKSHNARTRNFSGEVNGLDVYIDNLRIMHRNDYFQFGYERRFSKAGKHWKYHAGLVIVNSAQQEISIEEAFNQVVVQERNFGNSGLSEGGFFGGLEYSARIDTKFEAAIRMRGYWLVSIGMFEALTFTPVLRFYFR